MFLVLQSFYESMLLLLLFYITKIKLLMQFLVQKAWNIENMLDASKRLPQCAEAVHVIDE